MRKILAMAAVLVAVLLLPALADVQSGLDVGNPTPPFHPQHVAGPDRGTQTCPDFSNSIQPIRHGAALGRTFPETLQHLRQAGPMNAGWKVTFRTEVG